MAKRKFVRELGTKSYRKKFLIVTEGRKTEPQYFSILKLVSNNVLRIQPSRTKPDPSHLIEIMNKFIKTEDCKNNDEAWIVLDKDQSTDEQLNLLYTWASKKSNRYIAITNPQCEYWLLLHFEEGLKIKNISDCLMRLNQHVPNYDKGIEKDKITLNHIKSAIHSAKKRDTPASQKCPDELWKTTVYRLVEKIIGDEL